MRYVQFFLGVLTVLFLPVPMVDGPGAGSVVEDLDRFAWNAMIILVMAGSLVATAMPGATVRLFGGAGAIGLVFGVGTLTPMLVFSGLWTLFLAGIGLLDRRTRSHLGVRGLRSLLDGSRMSGQSTPVS